MTGDPAHNPVDLRRDRRDLADPLASCSRSSSAARSPFADVRRGIDQPDPPLVSAILPAKDEESTWTNA